MIKCFQESVHLPTKQELDECPNKTHNEVLLRKLNNWIQEQSGKDKQFEYQSQVVNDLMPITGNGMAIEVVWMTLPALYIQVGKTNYKDEAFTQFVNSIAKWPVAYRKMFQMNRTINLDGKKGRQLAGDKWVEDYLVHPIKQFVSAQSSFSMVEMMSCSANLLENNRKMYKAREAFDVRNTVKHDKPSSTYDQLKVAQFSLCEDWFGAKGLTKVKKYRCAGNCTSLQELHQNRYCLDPPYIH